MSILACSVLGLLLNREIFSFGKQDYSDPSIHPSEFHQKFQIYKDHVAIHEYSFTDYEDTVLDSIFIDAIGQFWSLGLESLDWYHLVDEKWIREEPKHRMILTSWYEEMEGELI